MYKYLGPTVKKLLVGACLLPLLFVAGALAGLQPNFMWLMLGAFAFGMLFPDLDVLTGWIRTSFQTMLLIIFVVAAVGAYPYAWSLVSGYCPSSDISAMIGISGGFVCELLLGALLVGLAYVLSYLAVSWLPAKNSFHHWTTATMLSGLVGMLNHILRLSANPWPLTAGFAIGYFVHIVVDGPKKWDGKSHMPPLPKKASPWMKMLRF